MAILDQFNRPLKDLRISVIDRCNFRCPYCMPEEKFHQAYQFLEREEWLSFDEIERLVGLFVSQGVRKIRLTGGEPLLRPNLDELIARLSRLPNLEDLALTTNGSLLAKQAQLLKNAGLNRLAVSLDSLDPKVFKILNGGKAEVGVVLSGLQAAQEAGFKRIKINAVIKRGVNDHTILDLVKYFRGTGHVLRFIEYMDVGNQNNWAYDQVVPSDEIIAKIQSVYPMRPIESADDGETAKRYCFLDGTGELGFISSVTHAFCGTCNRLRLSADGKMYTCLFSTYGTDLKQHLRQGAPDELLSRLINVTWQKREDRYSEQRSHQRHHNKTLPKIEMFQIGG